MKWVGLTLHGVLAARAPLFEETSHTVRRHDSQRYEAKLGFGRIQPVGGPLANGGSAFKNPTKSSPWVNDYLGAPGDDAKDAVTSTFKIPTTTKRPNSGGPAAAAPSTPGADPSDDAKGDVDGIAAGGSGKVVCFIRFNKNLLLFSIGIRSSWCIIFYPKIV